MNVKVSVFVICVEAMIYLLLDNIYECTFKLMLVLIGLFHEYIFQTSSYFIRLFR